LPEKDHRSEGCGWRGETGKDQEWRVNWRNSARGRGTDSESSSGGVILGDSSGGGDIFGDGGKYQGELEAWPPGSSICGESGDASKKATDNESDIGRGGKEK